MTGSDADEEKKNVQKMREQWLVEAQAIFERESGEDLGTIDNPTQTGFVELAKRGRHVWNTWREAYSEPEPDFSGIDFGSKPINFFGFHFPNTEDGRSCVIFDHATFGGRAIFKTAIFGDDASFRNVKFDSSVDFDLTKFGHNATFNSAKFGNWSSFCGAIFGDWTDFSGVIFGNHLKFEGASFESGVHFNGACFGNFSQFEGVQFSGYADFSASTEIEATTKTKSFRRVSFAGTNFRGEALFTGRQFMAATNFGPTRNPIKIQSSIKAPKGQPVHFHKAPNFHDCKLHQDTSFESAEFHAQPSPEAARAYRTLKLSMELLKATREEQKFFRLEMKAEHPSLPKGRRWISTLYAFCSDYGFSMLRPLVTLVIATLALGSLHGILANLHAGHEGIEAAVFTSPDFDPARTWQWLRHVLIDMIPVPGFDKTQIELRDALFGKDGWIVSAAMALEMLHKLIALGCVFLLGLALRNLFKMKS